MTASQMAAFIGTTGFIRDNGLSYGVRIVDVRPHYGAMQFLVQPIAGIGERWVNETTIISDNG
ncbi:MAG: hypothetical protein KGI54_13165 [Pseudomonadota bacterium]|nr:hypothetical protein [Pseudomonadota bacterium]